MVALFDKIYEATDEIKKAIKKPIIRRNLKMKFQTACDSATTEIDNLELELHKNYENLQNINVNNIIELELQIQNAKDTKRTLKRAYKKLFGTELKDAADEEDASDEATSDTAEEGADTAE